MSYMLKKMGICPTYVSEHNSNREKQVIILMIPNGEGWYYIEVKQLSALLRRITSKHNSDFYYLSCFQSLRTKNIWKVHENKDFCNIIMPSKILKY